MSPQPVVGDFKCSTGLARVKMKATSQVALFVLFFMFQRISAQVKTVETSNACVAQAIPGDLLEMLIHAATKILSEEPPEVEEKISEVKEKISLMTEDVSAFVEESKSMMKLLTEIESSHEKFGGMLNSVLNTILNNNNVLGNLEESNAKDFETIKNSLANINIEGRQNEIYQLLDVILQTMNNTATCKSQATSSVQNGPDLKVFEKNFEMQKETIALVRRVVNETMEIRSFNEQLKNVMKENEELRAKLKSRKQSKRPSDCNDLRISGVKESGVYEIYPDSCHCAQPIRVWCDMESEGGGWTVLIARGRGNKHENFTRPWADYEDGFGHPDGEYWIGNSHLYHLTSNRRYSLRVDVTNRYGISKWGQWGNFEVASPIEKYKLSITNFLLLSSLGNVFKAHNNQYFTTYDEDNDSSFEKNCAQLLTGGWWYAKCYDIHPTGKLNASEARKGVSTSHFGFRRDAVVPLSALTMKIKPQMCTYVSTVSSPLDLFCIPEDDNL